MIGEPPPGARPSNSRRWPGDRIQVISTGTQGWVIDYEYWWGGHTFPVRLDYPAGKTVMLLGTDVTVVHSARDNVVDLTPNATQRAGHTELGAAQGVA